MTQDFYDEIKQMSEFISMATLNVYNAVAEQFLPGGGDIIQVRAGHLLTANAGEVGHGLVARRRIAARELHP